MSDPLPARNYAALPLPERLEEGHRILGHLATHPELSAAMGKYKYGPESVKLAQGQALHAAARQTADDQVGSQGGKKVATQAIARAFEPAYEEYQRLADLARAAFHDDPATLDALGVGTFPRSQARRLDAFRQLSLGAREPARLAAFGALDVSEAHFDAFDALVQAYDDALHAADATRADAQDDTDERDDDVAAFDAWVGVMQRVARAALRGRPQLLELVGLVVRR